MLQPRIVIRGSTAHPRYLIENDDEKFWDGDKFVKESEALLYHHMAPASLVVRDLLLKEAGGCNTYNYEIPLQITVKADSEPDLDAIKDWLYRVLNIEMDYDLHGFGPTEDTTASTILEWKHLKKVSETHGK